MEALAAFILSRKQSIVNEWLNRVRTTMPVSESSNAALVDHVPHILESLAEALQGADRRAALDQLSLSHAAERYRDGYDLRQVVAEYRLLRRAIVDVYERDCAPAESLRARLAPLGALNEIIDEAIAQAVEHYYAERERTRDLFVGVLGHDLRNPLSTISLSSRMLLEASGANYAIDPQRVTRVATRILSASGRMERMISDLLDFARTRLGSGFPITPVPADLRTILSTTVRELAAAHPTRCVEYAAASVPADLRGTWDSDRLAQAVSNLVANAIQHGQDPVVVEAHDEGNAVSVAVRNGGCIPPEHVGSIFHPFRSGSKSGIRLGLYIVREIARAHGGDVRVRSTPEDGTVFVLTLPRGGGQSPAGPAQSTASDG